MNKSLEECFHQQGDAFDIKAWRDQGVAVGIPQQELTLTFFDDLNGEKLELNGEQQRLILDIAASAHGCVYIYDPNNDRRMHGDNDVVRINLPPKATGTVLWDEKAALIGQASGKELRINFEGIEDVRFVPHDSASSISEPVAPNHLPAESSAARGAEKQR